MIIGPRRRFFVGLVAAALLTGPSAFAQDAAPLHAIDVRVAGDNERTRFVADLTAEVDFTVFTLSDPRRVVIDLPETAFDLDDDTGGLGRGLIEDFRYGLISRGKSRIVLDLAGPVTIDKSFILPPTDGQPARLVVDVVAASESAFLSDVNRFRETLLASAPRVPLPPTGGPNDGLVRIVIDPGHGGIDSGAVSQAGTMEKDVVLDFALRLAERLRDIPGYDVHLTRDDDTFIALGERVQLARGYDADLFISVHADSFSQPTVRGASVYTLSERPSTLRAAEVAESENRSDIIAGFDIGSDPESGIADILLDLTRRETMNFSAVFARNLVTSFGERVLLHRQPLQQAGFRVLMAPDIPSVLVELGFLSNVEDDVLLQSADWQDDAGASVVAAVEEFFRVRLARGIN